MSLHKPRKARGVEPVGRPFWPHLLSEVFEAFLGPKVIEVSGLCPVFSVLFLWF